MPYINLPKPKQEQQEEDRTCEICEKNEGRLYNFYFGRQMRKSEKSVRYGQKTYVYKRTTYGDLHLDSGRYCRSCIFEFRLILIVLTLLMAVLGWLLLRWGIHLGGSMGPAEVKWLTWFMGPLIIIIALIALVVNFLTSHKTMGELLGIVRHYFHLRKQGFDSFFTETRYEELKRMPRI